MFLYLYTNIISIICINTSEGTHKKNSLLVFLRKPISLYKIKQIMDAAEEGKAGSRRKNERTKSNGLETKEGIYLCKHLKINTNTHTHTLSYTNTKI